MLVTFGFGQNDDDDGYIYPGTSMEWRFRSDVADGQGSGGWHDRRPNRPTDRPIPFFGQIDRDGTMVLIPIADSIINL